MKKYNKSIFIFRRDLRLQDNIGLIAALKESKIVIPIFILTPQQLVDNKYKSNNAVQFMIESLTELNNELRYVSSSRLFYFFADPNKVLKKIFKQIDIDAIYTNRDYTPYSKSRDNNIQKLCIENKVKFIQHEDCLLNNVGTITNVSGKIYVKFTPYYNNAKKVKVNTPMKNNYKNYYPGRNKIKGESLIDLTKLYKYNDQIAVTGGRSFALDILDDLKNFKNYNKDRNFFGNGTTKLSAYIKFGNVSIREVYYKFKTVLGNRNDLIKQLYWRDFYYNIMEYYPNIMALNDRCFKPEFEKVPWLTYKDASKSDKEKWLKWCEGTTGFPIVDAAMRELNTTGYMHNRGRMIVASFLTKNMFWHFKDGEKYFAIQLVDYDPSNNANGWQWVAGCGSDSMPYFRVFNPWIQAQKYDPDCLYIKKWVPELKSVPNKHIHKWYDYYKQYDIYYEPMLDASDTAKTAIKKLKKALN
jgi:deoxyribodipyrimidine photo-lyase